MGGGRASDEGYKRGKELPRDENQVAGVKGGTRTRGNSCTNRIGGKRAGPALSLLLH